MSRKPRILVVDADEGMRTYLSEALAAEGHTAATAPDAGQALVLLKRERFDLVVA
jgi:DNA-binding response OmpR family regulator